LTVTEEEKEEEEEEDDDMGFGEYLLCGSYPGTWEMLFLLSYGHSNDFQFLSSLCSTVHTI